jgi:hypothetical protein
VAVGGVGRAVENLEEVLRAEHLRRKGRGLASKEPVGGQEQLRARTHESLKCQAGL